MKVSAAILAGGKSSRMGKNKALLEVRSCRIIDHALNELHQVSDDVLLITNSPEVYNDINVRTVADILPGYGPLSGIHSALVHAQNPLVLIVACDMPFIDAKLAQYMINIASDFDVVVPKVDGYYEPLFALYGKPCIKVIEKCIAQGKRRVIDIFPEVKVKCVREEEIASVTDLELVFYNVNTPKELALAKKLIEGGT